MIGKDLKGRVAVAAVLAVVSFALIWWGGGPFACEVGLFGLAGSCEFFDMVERKMLRPLRRTGTLAVLGLLWLAWAFGPVGLTLGTGAALLVLLCVSLLRSAQRVSLLLDTAATWFAVMYVGWMFAFVVLIRALPHGAAWVTLLISFSAGTDIGAYFVGRRFGRTRLSPRLSPNKTVEGSLGGLLLAALVGWLAAGLFGLTPAAGLALGAGTSLMGQMGDLWESALKREVGVKDAGALLGEHGGVLDRFDSLAFAAPFFYLFLMILWHLG